MNWTVACVLFCAAHTCIGHAFSSGSLERRMERARTHVEEGNARDASASSLSEPVRGGVRRRLQSVTRHVPHTNTVAGSRTSLGVRSHQEHPNQGARGMDGAAAAGL